MKRHRSKLLFLALVLISTLLASSSSQLFVQAKTSIPITRPELFGNDYEIGIDVYGNEIPGVTTLFQLAYNNNQEIYDLGEPISPTKKANKWGGTWVQKFQEGGFIIYSSPNGAFYMPKDHVSVYDFAEHGLPLGDPFFPPKGALLLDKHTDFMERPVQIFKSHFIGEDIEPSQGTGYKAQAYYPIISGATVTVNLYDPDEDDGVDETKVRVTLDVDDIYPDPLNNAKGDAGPAHVWIESDKEDFRGWVPEEGLGVKVWEDLDFVPGNEFSFRLEAWDDVAGYLACDSYKKQKDHEEFLLGPVPLDVDNYSRTWVNECTGGIGGGTDNEPPVIIHDPNNDVWQTGKGWAIVAAEITDNVGVSWAHIMLNGELCTECIMLRHSGDTFIATIPLQLGRNTYYIEAADFAGNLARHPENEGKLHEIWSDMAFHYGYKPWIAYSDDPVASSIGNFVYSFEDATIPALGPDIMFERWFNHQSQYNGPFGLGWTFLYDMRLTLVDNFLFSGVQLRYADGQMVNFEGDGAGAFTSPESVQDVLEKIGDEYVLTTKTQDVYRFNEAGRLISISDKDDNTLTINYATLTAAETVDDAQIDTIVDANGRVAIFTYQGDYIANIVIAGYGTIAYTYSGERLVSAVDAEGNQANYVYDEKTGCMTSITSPESKPFLAEQTCNEDRFVTYQLGGTGYVNEFEYDLENRTTTIIDPDGNPTVHVYDEDYRVIENRDPLGNSTTYTYNDDYLPLTVTDKNGNTASYSYDETGNRLTATDALSNTTTFTYDGQNHILSRADALGYTTTYEYDAEGHLTLEIDPLGGETEYEYDADGLLIRTIDPLRNETETTYNGMGQPETITDALGNVTTKQYDAAGRLISETNALGFTTTYQYNKLGFVEVVTDPEGYSTSYEYDGDNNLIRETNGDGYSKTYTYDDNNRLVAETDWMGNVTTYDYDDLARKVAETDALGYSITYTYDAAHHLFSQTDKRGATTTYTYDAQGNVLTETDALGNVTSYVYDELNRQIEVHLPCDCAARVEYTIYDEVGRVTERVDARGNSTYFEYDELGREERRIDALGNATSKVYDLAGNLIKEIDALGNETLYEYDELNRLVSVTNRLGHTAIREYDAVGQVVAEIDERGNRMEMVYDGNGRLTQTIDALGNTTSYTYDGRGNRLTVTDDLGRVTTFVYDANGNVISMTNPRGFTTTSTYNVLNQITTITDALGNATSFTYDPAGAQLTITDPLGCVQETTYDILGRTLTETDRNGNVTTYAYDPVGNLSQITDALGGITSFTYDENNNRLTETNALGHTTTYVYDELNRQVEMHDALGGITESVYDALSRLESLIDANDHATTYTYDAEGQAIAITDALGHASYNVYDPAGNLIESTDRNGNTTTFAYDALNREESLTNALGHTGETVYDAVGNVIARTNFRGYTTQFVYDENNNLVQQIDAMGGVTSRVYDPLDRPISETDANGHTTTSAYDAVGRLLSVTLPEGQVSSYTYDCEGNQTSFTNGRGFTTTYEYDALNRGISETDPLGYTSSTVYDPIGQIIENIDANGNSTGYEYDALSRLTRVIDALGHTTIYTYDPVGNRLTKTDANGHAMIFVYDAVNRLIRETNAIGSVWEYTYDPEGNLIDSLDANVTTILYDFDAVHQMTAMHFADASEDVAYVYDENGNLIRMVDPEGVTLLTYDPLDREISKRDVYGYTTLTQYDAVGNRTGLTYPDGNQVEYLYNGNDWLVTMIDPNEGNTSYSYEDDGQVRTIDKPNDTWTSHVYDDAGRLIRLFNGTLHPSASVVTAYEYTLDAVGNRLEVVEQYTQGQVRTNVKSYIYNARYELLEAEEVYQGPPSYTVHSSYTYDPVGNRLSLTTDRNTGSGRRSPLQTTVYGYDAADRMLLANGITFTYDANGNRLTKTTPGAPPAQGRLETYLYDDQNRLITYTRKRLQSGQIEQRVYSVYDGLGRRVNKGLQNASGAIKWTRYALDGLSYDQLAEYPQTGQPRVTELYRGLDNMLVSMDETQGNQTGTQYWFAQDGLESVSAITKQNGQSSYEFFYDPYGQLIDENGHWEDSSSWTNPHNHYLLSGKEWDEESRMYYFGARFYDPEVGVWLTPDPYRGEARVPITLHPYFRLGHQPPNQIDNANEPMSLHHYLYAQNNPTNLIDIQGYSTCGPYAKCQTEPHWLVQLLFGYKSKSRLGDNSVQKEYDLISLLGRITKGKIPTDKFIPPNIMDKLKLIEFKAEYGYNIESKVGVNPVTLQAESCRSISPYASLYLGLKVPVGYYGIPGIAEVQLSAGGGGSLGIKGSVESCVTGDLNVVGGIDLQLGWMLKGSIVGNAELRFFVEGKGSANLFVASGSVTLEAGVKAGIDWPLLGECSIGFSVGITQGYGQLGCSADADSTIYVDLYGELDAKGKTFWGQEKSKHEEISYRLAQTSAKLPTLYQLLTERQIYVKYDNGAKLDK